jgi:hypothetical protein
MNQRYLVALMSLALFSITVAVGQDGPTQRFRWSERLVHELSYRNTIATTKDLTGKERASVLAFVLDRFQHPINTHDVEMFADIPADQMRKLAADTRIELVDLDGDGKNEVIAQGNGLGPCGGTGNCIVLILRITSSGIDRLLDSRSGEHGGGFEKIRVMDTTTNGFHDVVLASHVSSSERTLEVFRFVGGKYSQSDCYSARHVFAAGYEGPGRLDISHGCSGEK